MRPALDVGSEAAEPFHDVGHSEFALEAEPRLFDELQCR